MHAKVRQGALLEIFGPWKLTYEANLTALQVCYIESSPKNHAKFQYLVCFNSFDARKEVFWLISKVAFLKGAQNEAEIGPFFNGEIPTL